MAEATIAGRELLGIIQELEAEEAAIRDHNKVKSDIIKEAGGKGWDKKTIRKVMAARRLDPEVRNEQDDLFDMYMQAVEAAEKAAVHARVENAGKFGAAKRVDAASTPPSTITPSSGNIFVDLGFTAEEGREIVASKTIEHQTATGTEQGHVESSAPRASSAVRVGATNSPDGQTIEPDPLFTAVPGGEPSNPSSEADGAKMEGCTPPDRAAKAEVKRIHSEQAAHPIPHSLPTSSPVTKAETVVSSSPAVSATISDADVPAFLKKDKPGCGKLKGGQCKLPFPTSALCSDCQRAVDAKRVRA